MTFVVVVCIPAAEAFAGYRSDSERASHAGLLARSGAAVERLEVQHNLSRG